MKLRILENSIRLRLRRSEVEQLAAEGRVEVACDFGGRQLRYAITAEPCAEIGADFVGDVITIRVPQDQVQEWAASKRVGLTGRTATLSLLIEKDFVRSAVKEPDDYDRYMNPRTGRVPPPPRVAQ